MDSDALTEFVKLAVPPAVGVVVAAVLKWLIDLVKALRNRPEPVEAPTIVLPPGVEHPTRTRNGRRGIEGLTQRVVARVWDLMNGLPLLTRRATPWKAALAGGPLVGFGISGYFRTVPDGVIGGVLTIPVLVAASSFPDTSAGSSTQSATPAWAYAATYTAMALCALYSYLRAISSNRRLEGSVRAPAGRPSDDYRRQILERELGILAGQGWRLETMSDFDAVVSRIRRPNHALHLLLSVLTLWIWTVVWIARTRASRANPELEYRRALVDEWGNWAVEPL